MIGLRWTAVALVCFLPPRLLACSCITPPLKYAYKRAASVFVGQVLSTEETAGELVARFAVIETFKSEPKVGQEVLVHTSLWGETCGITFVVGEQYIVQTSRYDERDVLQTDMCTHTQPLHTARGEKAVRLLRSRAWWWRSPLSYPGRYPIWTWYYDIFSAAPTPVESCEDPAPRMMTAVAHNAFREL